MPRGVTLSERQVGKIVAFRDAGKTQRQIALLVKCSQGAVKNVLRDPASYGKKKRSGRPSKLTRRDRRSILRTASTSGVSSSRILSTLKLNVSSRTVRRVLEGTPTMKWTKMKIKPKLEPHHMDARLQFAQKHMSWTTEWSSVVWSDEKKN